MNRPILVCLGVCHRDVELACLWLKWVAFLSAQPCGVAGHLLICTTRRVTEAQCAALLDAIRGGGWSPRLEKCVDENEAGYPVSASHLFLRTLEFAEKMFRGFSVLWCEADAPPTKPSWFTDIAEEYQTCGKANMGMLFGTRQHQSGVSIYAHDWRTRFPSIAKVLEAPDVPLWGPGKGQPWDVWCKDETTPQMAVSNKFFTVWKQRDMRPTRLADIPAECCIFHQDKTFSVPREIAALRYPEFMQTLAAPRRFYRLSGHKSRLKAKGIEVNFSYQKYHTEFHGWVSAVCDAELTPGNASALSTMIGKLGLTEITEADFLKLTGRTAASLPKPKIGAAPAVEERHAPLGITHPTVFVMLGRYGDILCILPMLKAEADAGRRPTLVVSKDFQKLLDAVSYTDRIVWDGAYDQLPECLRWLRRDKGIGAPVVVQVHKNPIDRARLTNSYQRESWRLAGRLEEFNNRGPLVLDNRDHGAEKVALAHIRGDDLRPMVLVGLRSHSSPLESADKILSAIVEKFSKTHHVVNLAQITVGRPDYLLGVFDAAEVLLTADTMFLHLARASGVRVVALINSGWRGSVTDF